MEKAAVKLALVPCLWSQSIEGWLSKVDWDDETYSLKKCRDDVCSGRASVFMFTSNLMPVGCAVLRTTRLELVVMAVAGDGRPGNTNILRCEPLIVRLAEKKGLQFIRWHTSRPTMALLAEKMGYKAEEIVFRKKI